MLQRCLPHIEHACSFCLQDFLLGTTEVMFRDMDRASDVLTCRSATCRPLWSCVVQMG